MITEHEGKWYRTIDRNAKQGETIIIVDGYTGEEYRNGDVGTVVDANYPYRVKFKGFSSLVDNCEYDVLEPLEPEQVTVDQSQASEQVIEMFAALSRKIVSLERQLVDTQRNVERQAEELENAKHRINNHATMFAQVTNVIKRFYEEARR